MPPERDSTAKRAGYAAIKPRSPHLVWGGLLLIVMACVALWMLSGLQGGTLRSIGPAMLPRWLAAGLLLCGVGIVLSGFRINENATNVLPVRGPLVVLAAILLFAFTIRPLGLAFAGPATLVLGGFATAEARLRELVVMGCVLTAFCIILFGDMLNLPIPVFPVQLFDFFPEGWSLHFAMRVYAGLLVVIGAVVGGVSWLSARKPKKI